MGATRSSVGRSGETAAEFAAREGVNPRTLAFWKWKLSSPTRLPSRTKPPRSLDFVEVLPEAVQDSPIEIVVERYRTAGRGLHRH